jgi:hypothetical protein
MIKKRCQKSEIAERGCIIYIFVPPFMAMATFFDEIAASDGDDMLSYAGY